jgi:hypothetical protein
MGIVRQGFGNCHAHMPTGTISLLFARTGRLEAGDLRGQIQKIGNIQKSQPGQDGAQRRLSRCFLPGFLLFACVAFTVICGY